MNRLAAMAFRISLVFLVTAFAASCSLDTGGTAPANGDGVRDDDVTSESMDADGPDVPPDPAGDGAPPDPPPDSTACTPGEECGGGRFCCKKAEGTGCYDSLADCDCNGLEGMCSRQAKKCCNQGGGDKDLQGRYNGLPLRRAGRHGQLQRRPGLLRHEPFELHVLFEP